MPLDSISICLFSWTCSEFPKIAPGPGQQPRWCLSVVMVLAGLLSLDVHSAALSPHDKEWFPGNGLWIYMNVWAEGLQSWCSSENVFYLLLECQMCTIWYCEGYRRPISFRSSTEIYKYKNIQITHKPLQQKILNTALGLSRVLGIVIPLICDYELYLRNLKIYIVYFEEVLF